MVWPIFALAGEALVGAVAGAVASEAVGAVVGKGGSKGGANTQAYGSNLPAAAPVDLNTGLMSSTAPKEKEDEAFAVAETYQGTNPWELQARVQSWMPREEDIV